MTHMRTVARLTFVGGLGLCVSTSTTFAAGCFEQALGDSKYPIERLLTELNRTEESLAPRSRSLPTERSATRLHLPGHESNISVTDRGFRSYANRLELRAAHLKPQHGRPRDILDVGAGWSDFVDVVSDHFGAKAIAADYSYGEIPKKALTSDILPLFKERRFFVDARKMQFPDESFDLVVSNTMLNWFFFGSDTPSASRIDQGFEILQEMFRVTKRGGEIRSTDIPAFRSTNLHHRESLSEYLKHNPDLLEVVDYYEKKLRDFLESHENSIEIEFPKPDGYGYLTRIVRKK